MIVYLYNGCVNLTKMFNTKDEIETYCKQSLLKDYQKWKKKYHPANPTIPTILEKTKVDKYDKNIIKHILYYYYLQDWGCGNVKKHKAQITYNEIKY